jgi:pyruvate dehydrogenase E2 component (dihydrolipoamide acetyltransferase)
VEGLKHMGTSTEVKIPDIGDYKDVPVIEVLVKDGEHIDKDQVLLVLESDKATLEIPSPAAGVVKNLKLKAGAKVSKGDVVCTLDAEVAAAKAAPPPQASLELSAAPAPAPEAVPEEEKSATASMVEVKVPDIGDYHDVPVIEVLVKNGEAVEKEQPLLVLESDKATLEVPSPAAGIVRELKRKAGDKVSKGDFVCRLEGTVPAQDVKSVKAPATKEAKLAIGPAVEDRATKAAPTPPVTTGPVAATPAVSGEGGAVYAGPGTRKFARELGVDLSQVPATGPRGRIVVEDVQNFVKSALQSSPPAGASRGEGPGKGAGIPPIPAIDFSQFGTIETRPLARIRKLSAAHLQRAWLNVPHVTQFDQVDITELETFRKAQAEEGAAKLTLLPFVMKALAAALKAFPEFNSSLAPDGESLVMKGYCHVGFAADTENGLMVPVVRDVWSKGIAQLGAECAELAKRAREGKLKADDMKGGCISISSLGGIGGSHFTPIVNAPEVAILGVSRAQTQPVWNGKEFAPRLMCPLSLSYDHRVIDGAYAARFIVALGKLLADPRRLAL